MDSPAAPTRRAGRLRRGGSRDASAALRRVAAELSGTIDLPALFEDVLDESVELFGADRAGLWKYHGDRGLPFELATHRGLPDDLLAAARALRRDSKSIGLEALRTGTVRVVREPGTRGSTAELRRAFRTHDISTICVVPVIFRNEGLGLLVLYHTQPHDWSTEETALARSFADGIAAAMANARLLDSVGSLAARLRAIQDLGLKLNRISDIGGIGRAIVAEAGGLIECDTIRVYTVDLASGWCEPIAFRGRFLGSDEPATQLLRVRVGEGITGWVAQHNEPLMVGNAGADSRSVLLGSADAPESMLAVPMTFDDTVHGVIVLSRLGMDRFNRDDRSTLMIFAGYACQALVNARNLETLSGQREELELKMASQRRLLEVNERLLSTLDPTEVLELIADSLKTVVSYNSLTIYEADRERDVRRAVVARDRFADLILANEGPVDRGFTGWVIAHGEAILANEAHLDPRGAQIPGTPVEPEAMIVVPLIVNANVRGTLNVARVGPGEAPFTESEFELVKLFAGQASIALQNAEAHGAIKVLAEHDALTGLLNHGAFQRELGEAITSSDGRPLALMMMDLDGFKAFNDTNGHPDGDVLLAEVSERIVAAVREGDRIYRYGGDEFAVLLPGASRDTAAEVAQRIRAAIAGLPDPVMGPKISVSIGVTCFPEDGRTKQDLVKAADQALYLAKPSLKAEVSLRRDPYVAALDETAIALHDGSEPTELLGTILDRAAHLLGTQHGYVYLVEPDEQSLVVSVGIGMFTEYIGYRLPVAQGVAGAVFRTGRSVAVDDYDTFSRRAADMPKGEFGAVVGVPLTSGGKVVGVIGLAAGDSQRTFGKREIGALAGFAQLASMALDNDRLQEAAQRGALYDHVTGLPNRELLTDRLDQALTWTSPDEPGQVAVVLVDIDRFRVIAQSLGHAAGDRLLLNVGQRLVASVRPTDIVARIGGDEFGIVLALTHRDDPRRLGDRIEAELKAPFDLDGRSWFVSVSMGIALGWPGRTSASEVLREAAIALVRAKSNGTQRKVVFESAMSDVSLARVDLENDLRSALDRGELSLAYQPIVDLTTNRVLGFEALSRWRHPTRGNVPPSTFIPLAEESGLIVPIGRWALESACRQAGAWHDAFPGYPLIMSVNLSPREFMNPSLVDDVAAILADTGIDPATLELEITESVAMDESAEGTRALRSLRALGPRLVLDDFGTGYSSLSYLRNLPLDAIKIDQTFVTDLGAGDPNLPIVQAIIALTHGLGIDVVAEGITTAAKARRLQALGCDRGQGYAWARPMRAAAVERILRRGPLAALPTTATSGRGGSIRTSIAPLPRNRPGRLRALGMPAS
ncbi:MAG TPA: diguanylate cyclase [Candidatus Limnocylindrales bacterium]